jgi:dephospho-CoA kinase
MRRSLRIGLTGGIGSGKSAAAREFERLGATVIDTDLIARELVAPGQPALDAIIAAFGEGVLTAAGQLNRALLRKTIFADPAQRRQLETLLHPLIRHTALERAQRATSPYCLIVIPLLLESAGDYALDRVLVIDTPEALQRQRVAQRDQLTDSEIDAILAAQASRHERLALADDVILNDGDSDALYKAVAALHRNYLALAKAG